MILVLRTLPLNILLPNRKRMVGVMGEIALIVRLSKGLSVRLAVDYD